MCAAVPRASRVAVCPMRSCDSTTSQAGFTFIGLLFAIVLMGLALGAAGTTWSAANRRDRESQLIWAGTEIQKAIGRYYLAGPAGIREYPRQLSDLLEDRRGALLQRHLRRIYLDPMTGKADWELLRTPDGAMVGVASVSTQQPVKKAGFPTALKGFAGASCYCEWRFVYRAPAVRGDLQLP